jgi:hypothetical protein
MSSAKGGNEMTQPHEPASSAVEVARAKPGVRLRKVVMITTVTALGAALFAPHAGPSAADRAWARGGSPRPVEALAPPAGSTWIVGTMTDQAATGQDNVNVEAWPDDPTATEPAASALTYGGANYNAVSAHGFFRLEVPSDQPYRIVFSAVNGQEDGDPFRMQWYGTGRPIMTLTSARAAVGRVRDLGTIQLVRQGKVASKTKAIVRPAKVHPGQRGKLRIVVSSRYVDDVTGPFQVRVGRHQLHGRLHVADHGRVVVKLPKLHLLGKHTIMARFVGTGSVHGSKAKAATIKVVKKR